MVQTAAMHGDAALFDALVAAADRATDPDQHYRYLYALGSFRDPALVDRGLKRALRRSCAARTRRSTSHSSSATPTRASARSRSSATLDALAPKLTIFGADTYLIRLDDQLLRPAVARQVSAFFTEHKLPAAARALDQTLESINNCVDAAREAGAERGDVAGCAEERLRKGPS